MKSRIYRVTNGKSVRLIEGQNVAQVARFVIGTDYTIEPCNGIEAVKLVGDEGVKLESAMAAPKSEAVTV